MLRKLLTYCILSILVIVTQRGEKWRFFDAEQLVVTFIMIQQQPYIRIFSQKHNIVIGEFDSAQKMTIYTTPND